VECRVVFKNSRSEVGQEGSLKQQKKRAGGIFGSSKDRRKTETREGGGIEDSERGQSGISLGGEKNETWGDMKTRFDGGLSFDHNQKIDKPKNVSKKGLRGKKVSLGTTLG